MPVRFLSRSFLFVAPALALVAGCGNGGGGDPPAKPLMKEYGGGELISQVNGPATWENLDNPEMMGEGCAYPRDTNVYITGATVLAIDTFDETQTGQTGNYYVEDTVSDPPAYSGITAFAPAFTPPDLRLFPGDVIDFFGSKSEFPGPSVGYFPHCDTLPELGGTMTFRFDGEMPLSPKAVDKMDLTSYATARQWLGMLVRVEDVDLVQASGSCSNLPSQCRYTAKFNIPGLPFSDVPVVANELYDLANQGPDLSSSSGTHFKAITGIVTYFYGFHLDPRSPADFEQ
ncbi:MAG TPA: hypothetical protein VHB21_12685 [Minicystis sp.]|nr:hypothetical protein [Minicystis sp.]